MTVTLKDLVEFMLKVATLVYVIRCYIILRDCSYDDDDDRGDE